MSSQGGQKLPVLLSRKTTKRGEGVKNCRFLDDIAYGRPLMGHDLITIGHKGTYLVGQQI